MEKMTSEELQFGIVELMGHKVIAGAISKSELLGSPMLRVDVPETKDFPKFTQFYGDGSIYCVTFTSEDVAKTVAERAQVDPVAIYCPDLITVEKHNEVVDSLKDTINKLRFPALNVGDNTREDDLPV
jgi:hypothetical protein